MEAREHLAQADRDIAECGVHIARQRRFIERTTEVGHLTRSAESMLRALEANLHALETHRRAILNRLKG